jgi:predicted RND superfamily exporter protein
MSKGVVLGLLGTVVLLPCVIRLLDGAIEKTSHKPLLPDVGGIGRFVSKHYKALAVVLVLLCIPAFYGYSHVNVYYDMSKVMPADLPSVAANKKLEETFGMATTHLLLVDADVSQTDVRRMTEEMRQVDGVTGVYGIDSLLGEGIPESILPPDFGLRPPLRGGTSLPAGSAPLSLAEGPAIPALAGPGAGLSKSGLLRSGLPG